MSDRLSTDQWSRYWEKGTITTFHGRFGENYDGPVRDFWHGLFATLPGDARIVDLATGNGAVALLAAQYSHRQGRAFDIVGVDTAEIDPARLFAGKAYARHLRRIRFLARTPVGATTLPDSSQDLATSQFGIEYAETAATVAEVGRILKPQNATFAAMIHHADSAIVRQAKDGIEQIAACAKSGLHDAIRELHARLDKLASRGKDPQHDDRAKTQRTAINECLSALNRESTRFRDPGQIVYYVENSMATFNPDVSAGMSVEQKLAMLRQVNAETDSYRQRMRDLISAAQDDAEITDLADRLVAAGFRIDRNQPFVFEGAHFCQVLTARR